MYINIYIIYIHDSFKKYFSTPPNKIQDTKR